jgi:branched-chain amino acid transport system ATP-binding protein
MLEVSELTKSFSGLTAVDGVSFKIDRGELVGLIGPNGAGKTTLFNTITGVLDPDSGSVQFNRTDVTSKRPSEISQAGIARTFQVVRTFDQSTVLENVLAGVVFGSESDRSPTEQRATAREYLSFVGLEDKAEMSADQLTIADRKHVELARGLAIEPDLLMLDELGSGLTPQEIDDLCKTIAEIRSEYDIGVLWIEHIMDAIMGTVDRVLVLNEGQLIASGTPTEVQQNEEVSRAYLGGTA